MIHFLNLRAPLRVVSNPGQSLSGPVSVLCRDLDSNGAGNGVVTGRKAAHADQVLESLALSDIAYLLGVQGCFRQGDHDGVAGPKHSYEFVGQ